MITSVMKILTEIMLWGAITKEIYTLVTCAGYDSGNTSVITKIFEFIDGIRAPEFGHYHEAHFDDNLPDLDRSLPHVDIVPVAIHQYHPMREYMSGITGRLTSTWSFQSHDKRDPNKPLGPTPEIFILTFYPPLPMNPPFQFRLLFYEGNHLDELPEPTLDQTDVFPCLANRTNETLTIYVLAIIYLMATLPPEFVKNRTLYHYRLLLPNNLPTTQQPYNIEKMQHVEITTNDIVKYLNPKSTTQHNTGRWNSLGIYRTSGAAASAAAPRIGGGLVTYP
ncbi:predicted protein [Chaetoceros tenuissimus]|uniref:Uncharacterized protein n=1 Tax=Chaetoceros tenuissimus TaxID=426638 RepID=A0AAD3HCE6_9STRA|nr:predicted protein [Chaetoceros tenuissimus]